MIEDGVPIYQLGNSSHHDFIYPLMRRRPGIVVLHDLVLHHARLEHYLESNPVKAYREDIADIVKRDEAIKTLDDYRHEVARHYPGRGDRIAEIALRMGGGRFFYDYPLFEHVARQSRAVLVHSENARRQVQSRCPGVSVERIRMGVALPNPVSRDDARKRLSMCFDEDTIVLASFGLVTPEKQIGSVLGAIERLRQRGRLVHYFVVGATVEHYDVAADAARRGLSDFVHLTGRVDEEPFWLYSSAADLCLNLRYPSAGETSATLLGLMARARPVAVTDSAWGNDLPDDVVIRVSLDGAEDGLYCDLSDWLDAPARLDRLGRRARQFVSTEHSVEAMAADYRRAVAAIVDS